MAGRRVAAGILVAVALALAIAAALRHPSHIPTSILIDQRAGVLDAWVRATAPYLWMGALLVAVAAWLADVPVPEIPRARGRQAAAALALGVAAYCGYVSSARMDRIPHVFDEFNYLFQAKNFAHGHMAAKAPPYVDHFNELFFVIHGGLWYGSSLPGHPLLLAIGVLAGAPWLCNPLSAALSLLLLHRFLERLLGAAPALLGAALLALSPFFQILSSVFLAHATSLLTALAFLHFFTLFVEDGRAPHAIVAGAAFALGFLARPQAILVWALPLGAWAAVVVLRRRTLAPVRPAQLLLLALPMLPALAFNFAYNHELTGEWLNTPRAIVSPSHRLGFGPDVGKPMAGGKHSGHTPAEGIANVALLGRLLDRDLFGWWGASLLLVPLSLALFVQRKEGRLARDMAAVALLATAINGAIYFAYFTPSPLYGPRYFFELIPAFVLLTLLGGRALQHAMRDGARAGTALAAAFGFLSLGALAIYRPIHLDRYQPVKATALRAAVALQKPHRAVVLMPSSYFTARAQSFNDPELRASVIFGSDLGERRNRQLLAAMPGRVGFRFRYDKAADSGTLVPLERDALKVLMVGIDSATWKVMQPLIDAGSLPTFASLQKEGAWGEMATLVPTYSPALWTTMATGVGPERHGITGFVGGPDPERELQATSDRRRVAALWDMLGQRGLRCNVVNYWGTWPAEPINGDMVTDRATEAALPRRVHPPSLLAMVEQVLGGNRGKGAARGLRATAYAGTDEDRLLDLALKILDKDPASLSIVYFRQLDVIQHQNWMFYEPEGFDVPADKRAAGAAAIPAAYRRYDGYLKKLIGAMPPDATLVVVSDHGMESAAKLPPYLVLHMNRLLERLSLLTFSAPPIPDKVRSLALSATTKVTEPCIVYATSDDAVARVRDTILGVKLAGQPMFTLKETAGRRLTFELSPATSAGRGPLELPSGRDDLSTFVNERKLPVSGQHENGPPGIVLVRGARASAGGTRLQGASVLDVAPTVLALLGLPQGRDFEGKPLVQALDPHYAAVAARIPAADYRRPAPAPGAALPAADVEQTKEELRNLGYIQ